jgi:hypothetical protein
MQRIEFARSVDGVEKRGAIDPWGKVTWPTAPAAAVDGGWHLVLYEFLDGGRQWVPAQKQRNHWNSVRFSGIPDHEVQVGPAIGVEPPTPERLLEISRETGLREHLHGLSPSDARPLLARFVAAVLAEPGKPPVQGGPVGSMIPLPVRDTVTRP